MSFENCLRSADQRADHSENDENPHDCANDGTPVGLTFVDAADAAMLREHGRSPFVVHRKRVASASPPITSAVDIDAREMKKTRAAQTPPQTMTVTLSTPYP